MALCAGKEEESVAMLVALSIPGEGTALPARILSGLIPGQTPPESLARTDRGRVWSGILSIFLTSAVCPFCWQANEERLLQEWWETPLQPHPHSGQEQLRCHLHGQLLGRASRHLSPAQLYTQPPTDLSENKWFFRKRKCQRLLNKSGIRLESIDVFPPFVTVSASLLILKGTEKLDYAFNKIDVWSILRHTGVFPFEVNLMHFTLKSFIDFSKFHIATQCKVCFLIHEIVPMIQKFVSPFQMANLFCEITTTTTAQDQRLSASLRREISFVELMFCGLF